MSKRSAGKNRKSLFVEWAEDACFPMALVVRKHTETFLQAVPMTVDFAEGPQPAAPAVPEANTKTGNTEFFVREIPPPAKAA